MDDFDFEEDDHVLVRIRERGDSGRLRAKFIGRVDSIMENDLTGDTVKVTPPWNRIGTIHLKSYEAEFERVDPDEVTF